MPNVRYRERDAAPLAASSAGKAPQIKLKKGFSRAQKATIASIILLVAWLTILANLSRIPESFHLYAIVFPLWLAVVFGAYALGNIGYHLVTLADRPDAFESLQQEVKEAKAELETKGFTFST